VPSYRRTDARQQIVIQLSQACCLAADDRCCGAQEDEDTPRWPMDVLYRGSSVLALTIDDIRELFDRYGHLSYSGEPVTQRQHALQCAMLAERGKASDALVAAALLHDLGHLLNLQGETPTARGIDDVHQYFVVPFLRPLLPDSVLEPIRLHVDAKRYLCAVDYDYHDRLSADSKRSLGLQGGVFSREEAVAFARKPYAADAVRLRQWDDEAKDPALPTPELDHFLEVVGRVTKSITGADNANVA
jgi:phosphonate degradation associated HDIG domain protein